MMLDRFLDKLTGREKAFFLIAIVCVLASLADGLVVEPVVKRLRRLDADIKNENRNLVINMGILDRGVPKEYEALGSSLERSGSAGETINAMKDEIDALARKSGIELSSMEGREPVQKEQCEKYAVELGKLEASMGKILNFLHALQTSPEMLTVSKLNLAAGKDNNNVRGSMLITKLMIPSSRTAAAGKP